MLKQTIKKSKLMKYWIAYMRWVRLNLMKERGYFALLREIRCDEFKDEGEVRKPITFHAGLNTVMGASRASNSIGKTTFLLIIDYVFGGRDYVMLNTDVTKNVGQHTICFAFEFESAVDRVK